MSVLLVSKRQRISDGRVGRRVAQAIHRQMIHGNTLDASGLTARGVLVFRLQFRQFMTALPVQASRQAESRTCEECMSPEVVTIDPNSPLLEAARLMRELGIGALPVCQSAAVLPRLLGMITDRDIVIRVIAEDLDLERVHVGEVMSSPVIYCYADESPWVALHLMEQHLIRRLPVIDRLSKKLVGMLSISDLSRTHPSADEAAGDAAPWNERVMEVMGALRGWTDLR